MSLTTGEINERLGDGISITPAFITSLGVEPEELSRGKPKWSEDDFPTIVSGIGDRMQKLLTGEAPVRLDVPKRARRTKSELTAKADLTAKAAAALSLDDEEDDDEL